MFKIKSHKTVEQIAKKHSLDVSFVKHQLEMGIPIEHEHTQDKVLATDIALQHLDEIPDYYTRLKKMEADAKKHHKKFKDVKEHCGCEEDDAVEELEDELKSLKDTSYDSIDKLMRVIMKKHNLSAKKLHNAFVDKNGKTPDDWVKDLKEGTLHHWFKGSKSKSGKPGWVQADGSPCANEQGETKTPKCFSSGRLNSLKKKGKRGKALIRSAIRRKRQKDKGQQQKSGAAKPTNVPTFAKGKKDKNYVKAEPGIKESMELNEAQKDKPGKSSGKKDACYSKVKSRYDVWPSAYASGALVKCRKVGAANWGTKSEAANLAQQAAIAINMEKKGIKPKSEVKEASEMLRYCPKCAKEETRNQCKYGPKYWDMFSMPITLKKYDPNTPHPANEEKDYEYSMARSELNTIMNATKRLKKKMKGEGNIEAWVQSKITKAADYIDTAADYIDSGESKVNEDVTIEDANGNTFLRIIDIIRADRLVKETISPSIPGGKSPWKFPVLPKENPKNIPIRLIKGKEPKLPLAKGEGGSPYEPYNAPKEDPKNPYVPAPKRPKLQLAHYESEGIYIEEQVADTDIPSDKKSFDVAVQKIMKRKDQMTPRQRIVALKQAGKLQGVDEGKTLSQFMIEASAAWQRKEGKNPEGGLNKKGIASYRREHPGSHLSLAVTTKPSKLKPGSKKANRRKSFCSRMKGMKAKLTSAKTAHDPNSRINKSLRKWNC